MPTDLVSILLIMMDFPVLDDKKKGDMSEQYRYFFSGVWMLGDSFIQVPIRIWTLPA